MTRCSNGDCTQPMAIRYCWLCSSCYHRWARNHYRTDDHDRPIIPIAHRRTHLSEARYQRFLELVAAGHERETKLLETKLNVTRRTIIRYRARWKKETETVGTT